MSFLLGLPIFRGYVKFLGCTGELVNYAIAEHIENAGVHSGDASLLLPAQRLFVEDSPTSEKHFTKVVSLGLVFS